MLEGILRGLGRVPFVKELTLAGSTLGVSLLGCSKDSNPVAPRMNNEITEENNIPPQTQIGQSNFILDDLNVKLGGYDSDGTIVKYEARVNGSDWVKIATEPVYYLFNFEPADRLNKHTVEIRAVDNEEAVDKTPWSFTWFSETYFAGFNSKPVTPTTPITKEEKILNTGTDGAVSFHSDMDQKNVTVKLVDKNGNSVYTDSDIKYYSNLEQIVVTSFPKQGYLPSIYVEDRGGANLAGIGDGLIKLVTSALSESKYGDISVKLYNDLPNLFQNKTIIPGLLVKKGDWSFNDIKNGNYWLNTTSKILVPLSGGFTTPLVLGTEAAGDILSKIDNALTFIENVTGKKIDRDQKIGWYYIPLLNIEVPNLIPFFTGGGPDLPIIPSGYLNVPQTYNGATLSKIAHMDTVGLRGQEEIPLNIILDSGYLDFVEYTYSKPGNDLYVDLMFVKFKDSNRASQFNDQYKNECLKFKIPLFYFPQDQSLNGVYFFEDNLRPDMFFNAKNYWVFFELDDQTSNRYNNAANYVKEVRKLNP